MLERDHELKKKRKYKVDFYENSAMGRMRRGGHLDVVLLRQSSEVRSPGVVSERSWKEATWN